MKHWAKQKKSIALFFISVNLLSACGGDSGIVIGSPNPTPSNWVLNQFSPAQNFKNKCDNPRRNVVNPLTGNNYRDTQGRELDEKNWLRSWSNDVYLWYNEISDKNPSLYSAPTEYFKVLKTFAKTPTGKDKDQFHFTAPTAEYLQQAQSGVTSGYGATFTITKGTVPRELLVSYTQPNSPATSVSANLKRGTKVLEVDGADLVYATSKADTDTLNAGLFPSSQGETHTFVIQDIGSIQTRTITMTSAEITLQPVQKERIFNTDSGKVGYMVFNEHIATAEQQLINAMTQFEEANVSDLIIDLRYNGGGALYIAIELASMIAGPDTTRNQVVGSLQYNDKHPTINPFDGSLIQPFPFFTHTPDFSETPNVRLPNLDLPRVFVITGAGTCSASEALINTLRGVDLEVIQIGSTTCGKPYGFHTTDNCSTTYFSINFKTVNGKGFGDYPDGFSPINTTQHAGVRLPGCSVADDYQHDLGDPLERRLSAALTYRTGGCPTASGRSRKAITPDGDTIKPFWLKNMTVN